MTPTQHTQQPTYRWVILVAACVMGFITIGTRSTVSSFLKTIVADLGTNRETISFVIAANIWLSGLLQPFAGYIMDRFGARGLFMISVPLYGLGIGLIGLTHSVWYLLVIYGVLVGAASAGASMSLTNALLAQWFKDWRALAIVVHWLAPQSYLSRSRRPAARNAPGPVHPSTSCRLGRRSYAGWAAAH